MRPHTICLMMTSIDGRVRTQGWAIEAPSRIFESAHDELGGDAWIVGRVTMKENFDADGEWERGLAVGPVERVDWFANRGAGRFAIALDPHGRLNWKRDHIDGEHFLAILGNEVPDDYLAFLRHRGVSYILGGSGGIDFKRVLDTLGRELGIRRLLVEGGGGLNGAILNAGLLDELVVFVLPITDGRPGAPSLFDASDRWTGSRQLELLGHEVREQGILRLHYRVRN